VITVVADMGLQMSPRAELAVHGWVAFVEGVCDPLDRHAALRSRRPAGSARQVAAGFVLASTEEEIGPLVSILTSDAGYSTPS